MKIYIVQRFGVYDQGVYGVYDNTKDAKLAMIDAMNLERDGYHGFEIREYTVNTHTDSYSLKVTHWLNKNGEIESEQDKS